MTGARFALRDDVPEIEHDQPSDDREQRVDDVLDPDDRNPCML